MDVGFPTELVMEGEARIHVPVLDTSSGEPIQHLRSQAAVFYNPVMKINRDTAVAALRVLRINSDRDLRACEPMCGSGVRGVRLCLEAGGVESMTMGDLSPKAIRLAGANAGLNGVQDRIRLRLLDANLLMSLHCYPGGRFDYLDVDPYGSPSMFIDTGVRSIRNHGVIALTATDMAPLCGVKPRACLRKYGGAALQGDFCHEAAVRLMAGSLIRRAAVHETAATPVFSYYADHYVRLYARLDKGKRKADAALAQMGYIKHCPRCLKTLTSSDNRVEECCGAPMRVAGPLWLGELADTDYLNAMRAESEGLKLDPRTLTIMAQVEAEIGYPVGFVNIDSVCSLVGVKSQPTVSVVTALMEAGFRVVITHYDNRGLKTDAGIEEIKKIVGSI